MEAEKFKPIQSVNREQENVINDILFLHSPNKRIDVDVTYSKGVFYKIRKGCTAYIQIRPYAADRGHNPSR